MKPTQTMYAERIHVDATTGCWQWQGPKSTQGRALIYVHQKGKYAYRVIWEELVGPIPDGLLCCHRCDNPSCVNPEHIFLGTTADNMRDARDKGRLRTPTPVKGESNRMAAPVPDAEIDAARDEYRAGRVTQAQLAQRWGVGQSTVGRWMRREARAVGDDEGVSGQEARASRLYPCGTRAAYARHMQSGEVPCEECRRVNAEYSKAYRAAHNSGVTR